MLREHTLCQQPWWFNQFTAQRQGTTAFSGLMRPSSSSCATSLIVTREAAIAQLGECQTEDLKVSSSAPASHRAPVGAAPLFQRAHCPCKLSGSGVIFVVGDFTVCVSLGLYCLRRQMALTLRRWMGCRRISPLRECLVASSVLKSGHHRRPPAPTLFRQCTPTL